MNAPQTARPLRIGSLCSGYGGLDMAVQAVLGGEVVWVADPDPDATKVLAHHHPDVPNLGDIKLVDWHSVPAIDVLTGGYPCQPFSDAGLQLGVEDERHIWPYFVPAIRVLRPRFVVLENVRGHLGRGFTTVLGDLAALGLDAEWRIVRAAEVGASHNRARLIVLATPADTADLGHERGRPARDRRPGPSHSGLAAADPSSDGRHEGGPESARLVGRPDASVSGASPAADAERVGRQGQRGDAGPDAQWAAASPIRCGSTGGGAADADAASDLYQDQPGNDRAPVVISEPGSGDRDCPGQNTARVGGPGVDPGIVEWGPYEPAIRRWEHVLGRPAPRPTEPGRSGERLSPRFVEWMMGLPAGHVTDVPGISRNAQLRLLGNGVVPQQVAAAIEHLLTRDVPVAGTTNTPPVHDGQTDLLTEQA